MRDPLAKFAELQREHTYEPGVEMRWWEDNLGHGLAGAAIGGLAHALLGTGYVRTGALFLVLAAVWEAYEYRYEIRPWDPVDDWTHDRAVEDTLLDTYVGLTGALLAVFLLA